MFYLIMAAPEYIEHVDLRQDTLVGELQSFLIAAKQSIFFKNMLNNSITIHYKNGHIKIPVIQMLDLTKYRVIEHNMVKLILPAYPIIFNKCGYKRLNVSVYDMHLISKIPGQALNILHEYKNSNENMLIIGNICGNEMTTDKMLDSLYKTTFNSDIIVFQLNTKGTKTVDLLYKWIDMDRLKNPKRQYIISGQSNYILQLFKESNSLFNKIKTLFVKQAKNFKNIHIINDVILD